MPSIKTKFILPFPGHAVVVVAAILFFLGNPPVRAQGFFPMGLLYSCNTNSGPVSSFSDGYPFSALTLGRDGNFYGVSKNGGSSGYGEVFMMTPTGVVSNLYSFANGNDGGNPYGTLVQGLDGSFYGTTEQGGSNNLGVIFKITTNGIFTPLHSMQTTEGANLYSGLVQANDRSFLGVGSGGGTSPGTVFSVTTNGVLTVLHNFTGPDGYGPISALVEGADGAFYGTTGAGGTNTFGGTVFRITANGVFTSIFSSDNTPKPRPPYGNLIQGLDGSLYGTAAGGGLNDLGAVFRITTNGVLTNIYSFSGVEGQVPYGGLVQTPDGALYGACCFGGSDPARDVLTMGGSIFGITTNGVLKASSGFDYFGTTSNFPYGAYPESGLALGPDGNLYGACTSGGTNNQGSFFVAQLPALSYSNIYSFKNSTSDGALPYAGLVQGPDGNLYGTTTSGATNFIGSVFRITTNGTFTDLHAFESHAEGFDPEAPLVVDNNGMLYGTSVGGGANASGNVFGITTNGTFTNLFSFDGNDDSTPFYGALVAGSNGVLYGTTAYGGPSLNIGSVFSLTTNGVLADLYYFNNANNGSEPYGGLTMDAAGNLYGMTSQGGAHNTGVIFEITTSGVFTNLASFDTFTNRNPFGGLTLGPDGALYGATSGGSYGSVFRCTTNGQVTTLHLFNSWDGQSPYGNLYLASDGYLYGATLVGGLNNNSGTMYRISTNGQFVSVYSFGHNHSLQIYDGYDPYDPPVQGTDGNFYGTTERGGSSTVSGYGNIYRLAKMSAQPATGSIMVALSPDAVTNQAQWMVDADGVFLSSGQTVTNLSAGYHQICFTQVPNWMEPNCMEVLVNPGATTDVEAIYVVPPLSIQTTNNGVVLLWPVTTPNWQLMQNNNLNTANWVANPGPINVINGINEVLVSPATGWMFYKLTSQ